MENKNVLKVRKRYHVKEQALAIKLYSESGLSEEEFCEREGLEIKRFQRWQQRLKSSVGGSVQRGAAPHFVEVVREPGLGIMSSSYRLGCAGGMWLEIERGFDEREVTALMRIMREARPC